MMGSPLLLLLRVSVLLFGWHVAAQTSNSSCPVKFTVNETKTYQYCNSLSTLGATLSYTYHGENGSLDIAFKAAPAASGGWVGWGINPKGLQVIGTQALIAFQLSNGSTVVDTYDVISESGALNPSKISINVTNKNAVYESSSGKITIFASLVLDSNKTSVVNQVWQVGSSVSNFSPLIHNTGGANLRSLGTLNLQSGANSAPSGYSSHQTLKNRHGVINVVGWGILLPIGVTIARYARTFRAGNHALFYLHTRCQSSGYIIGVFALLLRPKKDHKFILYWNVYLHSIVISVFILSTINIYKGLDILHAQKKWKDAYNGINFSLSAIAIILEVVIWIIFFRRKSKKSSQPICEMNSNGRLNGDGLVQSHV